MYKVGLQLHFFEGGYLVLLAPFIEIVGFFHIIQAHNNKVLDKTDVLGTTRKAL